MLKPADTRLIIAELRPNIMDSVVYLPWVGIDRRGEMEI